MPSMWSVAFGPNSTVPPFSVGKRTMSPVVDCASAMVARGATTLVLVHPSSQARKSASLLTRAPSGCRLGKRASVYNGEDERVDDGRHAVGTGCVGGVAHGGVEHAFAEG